MVVGTLVLLRTRSGPQGLCCAKLDLAGLPGPHRQAYPGTGSCGSQAGHRALNRGTCWSGLGVQPAPIRHCGQQPTGEHVQRVGGVPRPRELQGGDGGGDAGLSSCWQKAAAS